MKDQEAPPKSKTLGEIGLDNFPPYLMNRIMSRYNTTLRDSISARGLSTAKMRALAVLTIIDDPLISELAVYSVIEKSTLSRTLDDLEARGLIVRIVDQDDSRAYRVRITAEGKKTFEEVWPEMFAAFEAMFVGIDAAERHMFLGTLKKILQNTRIHDF